MFLEDELIRSLSPDSGARLSRQLRVAIYSHDAQGLGHLRRNLLISRALSRVQPCPSVLLISGLRETAAYDLPAGVDSITLPALSKDAAGVYASRSLHMQTDDLVRLRSDVIRGAVESYRPDILIVDKLPAGIFGELLPALRWLRENTETRLVLGLRDILDDPDTVRREWDRDDSLRIIEDLYDRIWVYGDRSVYDVAQEYGLPDQVGGMLRYTGYLNPRQTPLGLSSDAGPVTTPRALDLPSGSLTLCVIGGGRDGLPLARAFLEAEFPAGSGGVLVTGPLMSGEDRSLLHAMTDRRTDVRLVEFVTDPQPLLCCADRVITMGGYNTVCELLALHKRALVVPRVRPRTEQLIRAKRLEQLGLIDVLHPDELSAGELGAWMRKGRSAAVPAEQRLDFNGVSRLPGLLEEVLAESDCPESGEVVVPKRKAAHHAG